MVDSPSVKNSYAGALHESRYAKAPSSSTAMPTSGSCSRIPPRGRKTKRQLPSLSSAVFLAPAEGPPGASFRENVLFTVQPLLAETNLDTLVQFGMRATVGQIQILSSTLTTLSGIPARQLISSGLLDPQFTMLGKVLMIFAVRSTRSYIFSYTARADRFDYYLPEVQQMIALVNIL